MPSWPTRDDWAPTSRWPTRRAADDDAGARTADDAKLEALGKLSPRVPLVVDHGLMLVRVRPAPRRAFSPR